MAFCRWHSPHGQNCRHHDGSNRVMQTRGTRIIEPAEWLSIINKGLTKGKYEGKVSTQLQVMSLRLALTDPTKEFHMTDAWCIGPGQSSLRLGGSICNMEHHGRIRTGGKTRKAQKNVHICHQSHYDDKRVRS